MQPRNKFCIELSRVCDLYAMRDHRIPFCGFGKSSGSRHTLALDTNIEPFRGDLYNGEFLVVTQEADIALRSCQTDIWPECPDFIHQRVKMLTPGLLVAREKLCDPLVQGRFRFG